MRRAARTLRGCPRTRTGRPGSTPPARAAAPGPVCAGSRRRAARRASPGCRATDGRRQASAGLCSLRGPRKPPPRHAAPRRARGELRRGARLLDRLAPVALPPAGGPDARERPRRGDAARGRLRRAHPGETGRGRRDARPHRALDVAADRRLERRIRRVHRLGLRAALDGGPLARGPLASPCAGRVDRAGGDPLGPRRIHPALRRLRRALLVFLATFSVSYALYDIKDDLLHLASRGPSDAAALARLTFIPAVVWGAGWGLLSLGLVALTLRHILASGPPDALPAKPSGASAHPDSAAPPNTAATGPTEW